MLYKNICGVLGKTSHSHPEEVNLHLVKRALYHHFNKYYKTLRRQKSKFINDFFGIIFVALFLDGYRSST